MIASPGTEDRDRWAVILAGGQAQRPLSFIDRGTGRDCPPQFFPLLGSTTLLEQTLSRVRLSLAPERTLAVVNRAHEEFYCAVSANWPQLELLVERHDLGTATAILYSLLVISQRSPDASVAIFPSDHYVSDDRRFMHHVMAAFDWTLTHPDAPVVLGIGPGAAQDDCGWIAPGPLISGEAEPAIFQISRFWEKPALSIAKELFRRSCLLSTAVVVGSVAALIKSMSSAFPRISAALNLTRSSLGVVLEGAVDQGTYAGLSQVDFGRSVLALNAKKFAVMPVNDIDWCCLGEPDRATELRPQEHEISSHAMSIRSQLRLNAAHWGPSRYRAPVNRA